MRNRNRVAAAVLLLGLDRPVVYLQVVSVDGYRLPATGWLMAMTKVRRPTTNFTSWTSLATSSSSLTSLTLRNWPRVMRI